MRSSSASPESFPNIASASRARPCVILPDTSASSAQTRKQPSLGVNVYNEVSSPDRNQGGESPPRSIPCMLRRGDVRQAACSTQHAAWRLWKPRRRYALCLAEARPDLLKAGADAIRLLVRQEIDPRVYVVLFFAAHGGERSSCRPPHARSHSAFVRSRSDFFSIP